MKNLLVVFFLLLLVTPAFGSKVDRADLEPFLNSFMKKEMEESHIPGIQFALVQEGRVVLIKGYGYANLERRIPVDPYNTVFRVGSVSKTMTATVVLNAVERYHLNMNEDLRPLFRGLPLSGPGSEYPLTLFHLLSQTGAWNEHLFGQHAATPAEWQSIGDYLRLRLPPQFGPPGKFFNYNDHNTTLAAYLVELKSGMSFDAYAKKYVFEPLGLKHTTFSQVDLPPLVAAGLATGYRYNGSLIPYDRDYIKTYPAAGLMTTAADMAAYMIAILECSPASVLSPADYRRQVETQFRVHPLLPGRGFDDAETPANGLRCFRKDGQASGFAARIFLMPDQRTGFFSISNLSIFEPAGSFNRAAGFHRRLNAALVDRYFPSNEKTVTPQPTAVPADRIRQVEGYYRDVVGSRHTIEKMIWLYNTFRVQYDEREKKLQIGQNKYVEVEPYVFHWEKGDTLYAVFGRDSQGRVDHLFIDSGSFEKIPWYAATEPNLVFAGVCILFFLCCAVLFFLAFRRKIAGSLPGSLSAILFMSFPVVFAILLFTTDVQVLFRGITPAIHVALVLPILAIIVGLVFAVLQIRQWKGLSRAWRSLVVAFLLVAAVFTAWLNYWNLLGFRF